jgi:CubicO group peptidase (beta-lactamase class C family)
MKTKLLILLFFLASICSVYSQSTVTEPSFIKDSLDSYVENALKTWRIPGVAICIVKDGKVVIKKGYGVKELNKPGKVDENTLFLIASNTKAFTGTAMAMLENENKCSLNDKVVKWLPDFKMKDPWVAKNLTLTDILCHRMGMETFQGDFMYWASDLTNKEVVEKFGLLTPTYDFRTKWGYTNAGFLIAGECIKSISGYSWAEYVTKYIFEPLDMKNTIALTINISAQKNIAACHTIAGDSLFVIPYPNIDNLAPAASICSSVNDLSHWLLCQLNNGKYDGKQVIPTAVIQKTRYPQSIVGRKRTPYNVSHYELYALGWELSDYAGKEIISHTGGANGFVTSVTLLPEEKLGIVVLTNTDQNAFYEALKWEIIDAYLNLPYRNYSKLYYNYFKKNMDNENSEIKAWQDTSNMNIKPPLDLANFAGKYSNAAYGTITITRVKSELTMSFEHHSKLSASLKYIGNNRFLCIYNDPLYGIKVFPFQIKNNKVISFTLSVADFLEFTTYEFIKL